jgi:hypothetical protein
MKQPWQSTGLALICLAGGGDKIKNIKKLTVHKGNKYGRTDCNNHTNTFALHALTYLLTYLLTHSLTPCSGVLLEKLTHSRLVKKFPTFHGTQKFIAAFTSAHHLSLSSASSIQSMPPHPTSQRSILLLSTHLRLGHPSDLFP